MCPEGSMYHRSEYSGFLYGQLSLWFGPALIVWKLGLGVSAPQGARREGAGFTLRCKEEMKSGLSSFGRPAKNQDSSTEMQMLAKRGNMDLHIQEST